MLICQSLKRISPSADTPALFSSDLKLQVKLLAMASIASTLHLFVAWKA